MRKNKITLNLVVPRSKFNICFLRYFYNLSRYMAMTLHCHLKTCLSFGVQDLHMCNESSTLYKNVQCLVFSS
uniref:Uncharacterized protein n=1 Tax=Zea mays TaxID=4577 RepID=B6UBN1_MAIZE|nr:hypothetical protein [Zea mays]